MLSLAGEGLNAVLEDLKLVRNLKMNRVTQSVTVQPGTYGPFNLESDYLRTYDMFYPLTTPGGTTQFLSQVTMEQFDAEPKESAASNFPYEFATDLSTQAQGASGNLGVTNGVLGLSIVTPGVDYHSMPTITFTPSGATATPIMGIMLFGSAAGAGYAVGDVIYGTAGTYTTPMQLVVSAIGGGGAVSTVEVVSRGAYTGLPGAASATTTTGSGVGYTFSPISYVLVGATITNAASGVYGTTPPAATLTGGTPTAQATVSVVFGSTGPTGTGQFYVYPMSATPLVITHRYMRNQPDIVVPETSGAVPWFPHSQYLIDRTAWFMMGISGDDRRDSFFKSTEEILRPYLIMQGDEQQTVQAVRLDPRRFRRSGAVRPTKLDPY